MLPLWLVYLLIVLILTVDVLLLIGLVSAVVALIISFALGFSLHVVEQKIEEYLREFLRGSGLEKYVFPLLHIIFGFLSIAKSLPATLVAIVYILLSSMALIAINAALAWLIFTNMP